MKLNQLLNENKTKYIIMGITFFENLPRVKHNYSHFPSFDDAEKYGLTRDKLYFKIKEQNILGHRYFYQLTSIFSFG